MKVSLATLPLLAVLTCGLRADDAQLENVQDAKSQHTACHGTKVEFVETPVEAAKLAKQQKKLVLVLHVSGYFEDPDFT